MWAHRFSMLLCVMIPGALIKLAKKVWARRQNSALACILYAICYRLSRKGLTTKNKNELEPNLGSQMD